MADQAWMWLQSRWRPSTRARRETCNYTLNYRELVIMIVELDGSDRKTGKAVDSQDMH